MGKLEKKIRSLDKRIKRALEPEFHYTHHVQTIHSQDGIDHVHTGISVDWDVDLGNFDLFSALDARNQLEARLAMEQNGGELPEGWWPRSEREMEPQYFYFLYEGRTIRSSVCDDVEEIKAKQRRFQALYPTIKLKLGQIEKPYFQSTLEKRKMKFDMLPEKQLEWPRILAEQTSNRPKPVRDYMDEIGYDEAKLLFADNPVGINASVRVSDFLNSVQRKVMRDWLDILVDGVLGWFYRKK